MPRGIFRFAKKVTTSSTSLRDDPPVETTTGFFVLAIFSIRTQSFKSELASLMIGIPSSTQRSTERSSKGVAVAVNPAWRIARTRVARSSSLSRVSSVFLTYRRSLRSTKSRWINESTSRNCSLIVAGTLLNRTTCANSATIFSQRSRLPRWLLAISSTNRSSKMSLSITNRLLCHQLQELRKIIQRVRNGDGGRLRQFPIAVSHINEPDSGGRSCCDILHGIAHH